MKQSQQQELVNTFNSVFKENPMQNLYQIEDFVVDITKNKDEKRINQLLVFYEQFIKLSFCNINNSLTRSVVQYLWKLLFLGRLRMSFINELINNMSKELQNLVLSYEEVFNCYIDKDDILKDREYLINQTEDINTPNLLIYPSKDFDYLKNFICRNDFYDDEYSYINNTFYPFDVINKEDNELLGVVVLKVTSSIFGYRTNDNSFCLYFNDDLLLENESTLAEVGQCILKVIKEKLIRNYSDWNYELTSSGEKILKLKSREIDIIYFAIPKDNMKLMKIASSIGLTHLTNLVVINDKRKKEEISIYSYILEDN